MDLFSLGELYVSDFLGPSEQPRAEPAELRLVMDDDTSLVHLAEQPSPDLMWGRRYWYRSGTNATMVRELADIVDSVEGFVRLEPGDRWVDVASNDGTLLSHVRADVDRVGVDPADDSFRVEAERHANLIVQEPFTLQIAGRLRGRRGVDRARVVTCIAMFYDLMDPTDFLAGVRELLDRNGLFVLQLSYTPLMVQQCAFDNICHEHARYYTLTTLTNVLHAAGFRVIDCQLNDVNGGSMRVYATHREADETRFGSQPRRDVGNTRRRALLDYERSGDANSPDAWARLWNRIDALAVEVRSFVDGVRDEGRTVWGYGASTKGNTLLQFFKLDRTLIDAIAERQPQKWGLRTVGTDIPICSEEEMRAARPDYLLVLPWHFITAFRDRERDYLEQGGKFIVPCPRFEIVGA